MNKHRLGTSDLLVSEIGFGCMSLKVHSDESEFILKYAFDSGINFFDTADLYGKGKNEELVGRALKPVRDQVIIATKVGNQWRKDGSGWDWNPTKEYIQKAVDDSLLRLQTDYIDLYQLHGGTIDDPINETIEAFEILKQQGKIREYGISSIRPNVIQKWVKQSNMVSVMMQYSLLDRRPEEEALDLLHQNNISVITRGTLAKGLLVGKPPKNYLDYNSDEVASLQSELARLKNEICYSIQYVLEHQAITSAVLGVRTEDHLKVLLESDLSKANKSDLSRLAKILPPLRYDKHR